MLRDRWNALSAAGKRLRIVQLIFFVLTVTAASLQLSGIWKDANLLAVPSVGLVIFIQSLLEWKRNRVTAVLGFLAAVSVGIMFLLGLYLK